VSVGTPPPLPPTQPEPEPEAFELGDFTAETLRLLRELRAVGRRERIRQLLYAGYVAALFVFAWGGVYALGLFQNSALGADYTTHRRALLAALPGGLTALALAVLLAVARDALWRGPVVPPRADVDWLLAQPVEPARVVRPWFRLSCAVAAVPGLLGGAVLGVALSLVDRVGAGAAFGWALTGGVAVPLLAAALGVWVQGSEAAARAVRRATPVVGVVLLGLVVQTGFGLAGDRVPGWVERIEEWSGPWGWSALVALAPSGDGAGGWSWLALGLLAVLVAGAVVLGDRAAARLPVPGLRLRSRQAAAVLVTLRATELRAARLTMAAAVRGGERSGGASRRPARRLPVPRRRWAAVPWRDALGLRRAPARVGRALLGAVPAGLLALLATHARGAAGFLLVVAALVCGYLGVAQLAEAARLEADDPGRGGWAPWPYPDLMVRHIAVPAVVGAVVLALGAACTATPAAFALAPAAPALAGAAVVNASRGPARQDLLLSAAQLPGAGAGPVLFLAWYAAGPAVAIAMLSAPLLLVLHGVSAAHLLLLVFLSAAVTVLTARWARARARR